MSNTVTQVENRPVREENNTARRYITPAVNIYEDKDGYVIEAEMPGVSKERLEITLDANELVLVGRRETDPSVSQTVYRESQDADYRRVFELDPAVDTSKISARIERGILTVTLPKAEVVKPRRITVTA